MKLQMMFFAGLVLGVITGQVAKSAMLLVPVVGFAVGIAFIFIKSRLRRSP